MKKDQIRNVLLASVYLLMILAWFSHQFSSIFHNALPHRVGVKMITCLDSYSSCY